MREVTRDEQFPDQPREDTTGAVEGVLQSTGPSESELVTIALLMRLYDINLAILNHLDEDRANEIYEAHEKGATFNPPVFIPELSE